VQRARDAGQRSVVLTFDPHPSEVVRPGSHPAVLTNLPYKADLVERLGADALCVIDFTPEFGRLEPDAFVHQVLVEHLHASAVVVGANFHYGHRAAGDIASLQRAGASFGFVAEEVALFVEEGVTLSSTYIRSCVAAGDIGTANTVLGRPHRVEGIVVRGDQRGRELGYPTANLTPLPHSAVPGDGVYAGWLHRGDERFPAAISIGTNPTFEGRDRRVEAFVLDRDDLDLYGEQAAFEFVARLRETLRFDSVDALVAQMADDVKQSRAVLNG
jgi:riboflavin kinase/FMN adenylyltransferase